MSKQLHFRSEYLLHHVSQQLAAVASPVWNREVANIHFWCSVRAMAAPLGITTSMLAETWGLLIAVRMATQHQWPQIWFEVDSQALVSLLKLQQPQPWYLTQLIQEIQQLLTGVPNYKITHTLREANQVADALANRAIEDQIHLATLATTLVGNTFAQTFYNKLYSLTK